MRGVATNDDVCPPGNIVITNSRENFPDAWIRPEESHCVEIKAAELVTDAHTQNNWAAGYTLRFPRVERFRTDKGICDVTTFKDIEKLYNEQGGKLFSLKGDVMAEGSSAQNKRLRVDGGGGGGGGARAVPVGVGAAFRQTHLVAAEKGKTSNIFTGREFVIYDVGKEHFGGSNDALARMLHAHGATGTRVLPDYVL